MANVCPKAINFAIAELIVRLLVLRPHPIGGSIIDLLSSSLQPKSHQSGKTLSRGATIVS